MRIVIYNLFILLLLFQFFSCTTIHYQSKGKIPVYLGARQAHSVDQVVEGELEFFLWGLYPKDHTVSLDEEFAKFGHKSISKVKVREYQSVSHALLAWLTLGFYYPVNYRLEGLGIKPESNESFEWRRR